jgi:Ca-activated chloride channel family protein
MAATGVTTSTYGLGRGFNETLMIEMARAGRGNNYYGETAADLMDPFREEFALLNALCARNTVLQAKPVNGVRVELLNEYTVLPGGGWRLPDLAYGAEAWAVLRLTAPVTAESVSPGELFTATLSYQSLTGETCAPISGTLALPAVSQALFGTLAEDVLVLRRLGELDAAKLQEQARSAAKRQDWAQVDMLLGEVSKLGADNPWVAGIVKELKKLASRRDDVLFQKEAAYSSNRMRGRMTAVNESADIDAAVPAFLRRKMAQGKAEPDATPKQ